jgi:hypothetical protein
LLLVLVVVHLSGLGELAISRRRRHVLGPAVLARAGDSVRRVLRVLRGFRVLLEPE